MRDTSDPWTQHVQRSSLADRLLIIQKKLSEQMNLSKLTMATWLYLPPGPPRIPMPGTRRLADLRDNILYFPSLHCFLTFRTLTSSWEIDPWGEVVRPLRVFISWIWAADVQGVLSPFFSAWTIEFDFDSVCLLWQRSWIKVCSVLTSSKEAQFTA